MIPMRLRLMLAIACAASCGTLQGAPDEADAGGAPDAGDATGVDVTEGGPTATDSGRRCKASPLIASSLVLRWVPDDPYAMRLSPDEQHIYAAAKAKGGGVARLTSGAIPAPGPLVDDGILAGLNFAGIGTEHPTPHSDGLRLVFESRGSTPDGISLWFATRST